MKVAILPKKCFIKVVGTQQTARTVRHVENKISLGLASVADKSTACCGVRQYGNSLYIYAIARQAGNIHNAKGIVANTAKQQ